MEPSDRDTLLQRVDSGYGAVDIEGGDLPVRGKKYWRKAIFFVVAVVAVLAIAITIHHFVTSEGEIPTRDSIHDEAVENPKQEPKQAEPKHSKPSKSTNTADAADVADSDPKKVSVVSKRFFEVNKLIYGIEVTTLGCEKLCVDYWEHGVSRDEDPFLQYCYDPSHEDMNDLDDTTTVTLYLLRLHQETMYHYEVHTEATDVQLDENVVGEFTSGRLPDVLRNLDLTVIQGRTTYGLSLTSNPLMDGIGPDKPQTVYMFDEDGKIVWYIELIHPLNKFDGFGFDRVEGSFNVITQGTDRMQLWSPLGELLQETLFYCPLLHHEGSYDTMDTDFAFTLGSRAEYVEGFERDQLQDVVVRWDIRNDKLDEIIYFMDHLDIYKDRTDASNVPVFLFWEQCPEHEEFTKDGGTPDNWSHVNSVRRAMDDTNQVICSLKALDKVVSFSPDFKEVVWTLNGYGSDFRFEDQDDRFYHPHDAQILPNGNVLLMDNGNVRPKAYGGPYSRALELEIDHKNKIVRKAWDFKLEIDGKVCESPNGGGAQRLKNGNTIVQLASCSGEGSPTGLVSHTAEVTPDGEIVFHMSITVNDLPTYRVLPQSTVAGEQWVYPKSA